MRAGIARSVRLCQVAKSLGKPQAQQNLELSRGTTSLLALVEPRSTYTRLPSGRNSGWGLLRVPLAKPVEKGKSHRPHLPLCCACYQPAFLAFLQKEGHCPLPCGNNSEPAQPPLTPGGLLQFSELEGPVQGPLPGSPSDTWDTWLCPRRPARRSSCRIVCGRRAQGRCWQHGGGRRHTPFLLGLAKGTR